MENKKLKLKYLGGSFNFDKIEFELIKDEKKEVNLPGIIEAEEYTDYFDTTAGNKGKKYRTDDVDIQECIEGGYNIGWIRDGEWTSYNIDNIERGKYSIELTLASGKKMTGKEVEIYLNDTLLGKIEVDNTGGWQKWEVKKIDNINLLLVLFHKSDSIF